MFPFPNTWTCHVCGDERPDEKISVQKNDRSAEYGLPAGSMVENVRYCNDRASCREGAKTFSFSAPRKGEGHAGRA